MSKDEILVSVVMTTYNHERYVAQAIESILMQETDFNFELIIGEDCSTDTTRSICESYAEKYPNIRLLPSEKNWGMIPNFIRVLKAASGKYIAFCEGDDYWTDKKKINKQKTILEENPGYILAFHKDEILDLRNNDYKVYDEVIVDPTIKDLLNSHFIPSESMFFRNCISEQDYQLLLLAGSGDIALQVLLRKYGRFYYIDQSMSVYRLLHTGVTANYSGNLKRLINNAIFFGAFIKNGNETYSQFMRNRMLQNLKQHAANINSSNRITVLKIKLINLKKLFIYIPGTIIDKMEFIIAYLFYSTKINF